MVPPLIVDFFASMSMLLVPTSAVPPLARVPLWSTRSLFEVPSNPIDFPVTRAPLVILILQLLSVWMAVSSESTVLSSNWRSQFDLVSIAMPVALRALFLPSLTERLFESRTFLWAGGAGRSSYFVIFVRVVNFVVQTLRSATAD